jgi:hypothetical protein
MPGFEVILHSCIFKSWVDAGADIIGPNSTFVGQSGTYPKGFADIEAPDKADQTSRAKELVAQGLEVECGVPVDENSSLMWRVLGGLGSHDLSAMREALGTPTKVLGSHLGFPFWKSVQSESQVRLCEGVLTY